MGNEEIIQLNSKTLKKEFSFNYQFSFLSIKKIIVSHLFGKETNEWFLKMMEQEIYLEIFLKRSDNATLKYPVMLMTLVSPMHRNPVFEFNKNEFVIPEDNFNNKSSSFAPYYKNAEIRLKYKENKEDEDDNIKITIIYETSPGTTLV